MTALFYLISLLYFGKLHSDIAWLTYCVLPPFCKNGVGGRFQERAGAGVEPLTKFSKGGDLTWTRFLERSYNIYIKNKLKSKISNEKKS